jgi:hypothetical protein
MAGYIGQSTGAVAPNFGEYPPKQLPSPDGNEKKLLRVNTSEDNFEYILPSAILGTVIQKNTSFTLGEHENIIRATSIEMGLDSSSVTIALGTGWPQGRMVRLIHDSGLPIIVTNPITKVDGSSITVLHTRGSWCELLWTGSQWRFLGGSEALGEDLNRAISPSAARISLELPAEIPKSIINIFSISDGNDYTITIQEPSVFGGAYIYTPIRSDSRFLIFATVFARTAQTGTDNDMNANISFIAQNNLGTYTSQEGFNTGDINLGLINTEGVGIGINGGMSFTVDTNVRNPGGNLCLRHYGNVFADNTSGYDGSLTVRNTSIVILEYV